VAQKEYIQLAPTRQRLAFSLVSSSRSSLWLGKDHLLLVDTEGYTETYKRFYFRDIQAFILRKTVRMTVLLIITGLFVALFGFCALAIKDEVGKWVFGILTGVVAIPFLLNLFYGPTCSCQLRTAVQTEELPSISRVRRARKILARLRPLIVEAQGQLTPEEIAARMRTTAGVTPTEVGTPPVTRPLDSPPQASG